jgi:hypothetical protein
VDLSTGGALLESPFQLRPGSRLTVEMLTSARTFGVPLRLLRCYVSGLKQGPRYRAACAFEEPLQLPALLARVAPPVESQPFLRLLAQMQHDFASDPTLQGTHLSELLTWVTAASRRSEPSVVIASRAEAHLHRLFPTLVVRDRSASQPQDPETMTRFFDLEFCSSLPLTRSDRRYLRAYAQIISLLGARKGPPPAPAAPLIHAAAVQSGDIARTPAEWLEMCGRYPPSAGPR